MNSPSSGSNSSCSSKVREKRTLIKCAICEQGTHDPKVCPWLYSRCKHVPCHGLRQLLRSNTRETNGKMFLKCSNPTCTYYEWFDRATDPVKSKMIQLPVEDACYACGVAGHWLKDCPLHNESCPKAHCNSKMTLKLCNNEHNRNIAYLTCTKTDCDGFKWASDAIFIAAKNKVRALTNLCTELEKIHIM